MEFMPTPVGPATLVRVSGRIDHETSAAFEADLVTAVRAGRAVVLDFSQVSYVSSVGLRALMLGAREAKAAGSPLAVADSQPVVKEIFEISRFHFVVKLFATVGEAFAAIAPDAVQHLR
jgi:anti-anti-sigma factor